MTRQRASRHLPRAANRNSAAARRVLRVGSTHGDRHHRFVSRLLLSTVVAAAPLFGCATPRPASTTSVADAWRGGTVARSETREAPAAPTGEAKAQTESGAHGEPSRSGVSTAPAARADASANESNPIAWVDGRPISRRQVVDLLLNGHGAALIEQLVVLSAAEQAVAKAGLTVSDADVNDEFDQALRRMVDPTGITPDVEIDRTAAERLLDEVLASRNISRDEFMLTVRRNAHLRLLATHHATISEADRQAELEALRSPRARVRHIQLRTLVAVSEVQRALTMGEDFASAAAKYSANTATARQGGLMAPLARDDARVPELLRSTAFRLTPGQVSGPIRIGEWYHLVRLEEILPGEDLEFSRDRARVESRIMERQAESGIEEWYRRLLTRARVQIADPALERAYRDRMPPG